MIVVMMLGPCGFNKLMLGGGMVPCVRMRNQADYWPLSDLGYAITHSTHPPYDTPLFFCRCSWMYYYQYSKSNYTIGIVVC